MTRRTTDHTKVVAPTQRFLHNSKRNLLTTDPSQPSTPGLKGCKFLRFLDTKSFLMAARKVWLLSHQSLRHLTRASLARVILVSTLIYFGKNCFCYDKILFRLFHYFVAFTLEEPFLSRRNISLRKFSSFFTIVFIFGPPLFQDRPICSQPAFLKKPLYFRGKLLSLINLIL